MATRDALTPAQLKLLQKDLPSASPYGKGKSPFKGTGKGKGLASNRQPLMITHGKYFNEHGQIIENPAFGIDRGGNPVHLEHMEQTPEERIRNEELHKLKYHNDLTISKATNNIRPSKMEIPSKFWKPEGTKMEKLYLEKKGWVKRLLNKGYA